MSEQLGRGGMSALQIERATRKQAQQEHREAAAEVSRLHLLVAKLSAENSRVRAEKQKAVRESRKWENRAKDNRRQWQKLKEQAQGGTHGTE